MSEHWLDKYNDGKCYAIWRKHISDKQCCIVIDGGMRDYQISEERDAFFFNGKIAEPKHFLSFSELASECKARGYREIDFSVWLDNGKLISG